MCSPSYSNPDDEQKTCVFILYLCSNKIAVIKNKPFDLAIHTNTTSYPRPMKADVSLEADETGISLDTDEADM